MTKDKYIENDIIDRLKESIEILIDYANLGIDSLGKKANVLNIRENEEFLDIYRDICGTLDSLVCLMEQTNEPDCIIFSVIFEPNQFIFVSSYPLFYLFNMGNFQ